MDAKKATPAFSAAELASSALGESGREVRCTENNTHLLQAAPPISSANHDISPLYQIIQQQPMSRVRSSKLPLPAALKASLGPFSYLTLSPRFDGADTTSLF